MKYLDLCLFKNILPLQFCLIKSLTLEFIQSEGKYDGNIVNRRRSVKKSAMRLGNPRGKNLEKNT